MTDKSRKTAEENKADMDKLFLEKSRVRETMTDMVRKLAANSSRDPLQFMADYFQSSFEQSKRLDNCYHTILLTHHSRPAFRQNLASAYDILSQTKLGKNLTGVNGLIFEELLSLLLQETPESHVDKIKQKLSRRSYEVVTYDKFYSSVMIIIIYKDYLQMADHLFELLDVKDTGQVDKVYAELLLAQLKSTFTLLTQQDGGIQAGITLSPDSLYSILSKVPHTTTGKHYLTNAQFMELSADAYCALIHGDEVT